MIHCSAALGSSEEGELESGSLPVSRNGHSRLETEGMTALSVKPPPRGDQPQRMREEGSGAVPIKVSIPKRRLLPAGVNALSTKASLRFVQLVQPFEIRPDLLPRAK